MTVHWTRASVEALGPTTDVKTAASIVGVGSRLAYELIQRNEWPTRVLRLGTRILIPTHDLLVLLYAPENSEAGPASPATANVHEDNTNDDHTISRTLRAAR